MRCIKHHAAERTSGDSKRLLGLLLTRNLHETSIAIRMLTSQYLVSVFVRILVRTRVTLALVKR